ncbi:replication initiation negative regulator SeqA, partial [Vibrio campbellii]
SDILRRLLKVDEGQHPAPVVQAAAEQVEQPQGIVVSKDAGRVNGVDSIKEMRSLLISDEFAGLKKAIDRFMLVLSTLYTLNPADFSEAMQVKGRKRV